MAPQQYPKWIYHASEPAKKVANAEEHALCGPDWYESPADVPRDLESSLADPPASGESVVTPVNPPVDPPAPPVPDEDDAAADEQAEAEAMYGADEAVLIEKLVAAPVEVLEKVRRFELANPHGPRVLLLANVQELLGRPAAEPGPAAAAAAPKAKKKAAAKSSKKKSGPTADGPAKES